MNIKIATHTELLKLRRELQSISDISYAFNRLNQTNPLGTIDQEGAEQLIKAYKDLLEETR